MSRLLLDTHVILWWFLDERRLSAEVTAQIEAPENEAVVSAVTGFEIATKSALGKLTAPADLADRIMDAGFDSLAVTLTHGFAAGRLPLHHRDPFDRLLIAQAQCDGFTLVTADEVLAAYDVPIMSAE